MQKRGVSLSKMRIINLLSDYLDLWAGLCCSHRLNQAFLMVLELTLYLSRVMRKSVIRVSNQV